MTIKQSGKKTAAENPLSRFMKSVLQLLSDACDAYVRGMNSCATKLDRTAAMGFPAITPRSYSFRSSSDSSSRGCGDGDRDLRDLIRAASLKYRAPASPAEAKSIQRSQSVAAGRIDEDKPCEFDVDVKVGSSLMVPRSRSCGVRGTRKKVQSISS